MIAFEDEKVQDWRSRLCFLVLVSRTSGQASHVHLPSPATSSLMGVLLAREQGQWKLSQLQHQSTNIQGATAKHPVLCQVLWASSADLKRKYTEQQRKPSTK